MYYRKVYSELYGKNGYIIAELDEEFYCTRAIIANSKEVYTSNFRETEDYGLPEGCWEEFINDLDIISEDSFNQEWRGILSKHKNFWEETKLKLKSKDKIQGTILRFYPQGAIIDIGEIFLGIADYEKCKKILGSERMYFGTKVKVKVKLESYDEVNMWVKLSVEK